MRCCRWISETRDIGVGICRVVRIRVRLNACCALGVSLIALAAENAATLLRPGRPTVRIVVADCIATDAPKISVTNVVGTALRVY